MPANRVLGSLSALEAGPFSPLEDLERRLTEASFHPEQLASISNMADNALNHRQIVFDGESPTLQDDEVVRRKKGSARWPTPWRRNTKASIQTSDCAEVRVTRASTLPDLPSLPSLPEFEEGNFEAKRLSLLPAVNARRREARNLPNLPHMEAEDNSTTKPHNEQTANQRNKGKNVLINVRGREEPPTKDIKCNPLQPSGLQKRHGPRRFVTESDIKDRARANSATGQGGGAFLSPSDTRSRSAPSIPEGVVAIHAADTREKTHEIPRKPVPTAMCRSPGCPIKHPHPQGLYPDNDQLSQWRHPYWGISNPPQHIWTAWDRRTDKIATPQEVGDIIGFMENHSCGPHGKAKDRASPADYKVAGEEKGDAWTGGFF